MRLNNLVKKIFAAGLAVSLMMANAGVSFADYSVAGGKTPFSKYLIMDEKANVPNAEFVYTIAPGTAIDAGKDTLAVLAGPAGATVGKAEFKVGDTTYNTKQDGDTVTLPAGKKYAKASIEVDLTGVTFTEPGVYRYIITETNNQLQGITYDSVTTRTLDVYVEDNSTEREIALKVAGYVLHKGIEAPKADGTDPTEKNSGFENTYETKNLTFSKTVAGNQGSKDKYFEFTLNISNAVKGTEYTVNIDGAEASPTKTAATKYDSMTNPTKITVGEDGTVTQKFYLKHNQQIVVEGLAVGTGYEVTEVAEDYTSEVTGEAKSGQGGITADVTAAFTNTRDGVVPTGVILDSAPFILIIVLAAAALAFTAARKKNR